MNSKFKILRIIAICGACISFYIGAGFATMQEVVQYEASYGSLFWIVIAVCAVLYVYTNISFTTNANRLKLTRGGEIFEVYTSVFGKKFGKYASLFFDWFSAIYCYLCFWIMCGGAASTVSEQWGFPKWVGSFGLATLVCVTVVFGLDGVVNALSKIGPVIIALILAVSVISTVKGFGNINTNCEILDSGELSKELKQVGGNPLFSAFSYSGFVIIWFAAFLAELGAKNKLNEVNKGMGVSAAFIFGASVLCCLALIGNMDAMKFAIPARKLAEDISPVLAFAFSIIICAGIYSSAVPLLWTSVRKVAEEKSMRFTIIAIGGGLIGAMIPIYFDYSWLVNIIYGYLGFLGFALVFFMIIYDIKTKMSKTKINTEN